MRDMGIVHGSKESAAPLVVGKDTVYVHTDIKTEEVEGMDGEKYIDYSYHEIQYTHPEFIKLQADTQEQLQENVINTQLALLELYESME